MASTEIRRYGNVALAPFARCLIATVPAWPVGPVPHARPLARREVASMMPRRLLGALLALVLPASVALTAVPASADALAAPPSCATTDPSDNCVHAATPDIVALPAPAFTQTYDPKTHQRQITFVAAITPPHPTCPDGGVPYADIPCTFRGLAVSARVYVPGAKAAALTTGRHARSEHALRLQLHGDRQLGGRPSRTGHHHPEVQRRRPDRGSERPVQLLVRDDDRAASGAHGGVAPPGQAEGRLLRQAQVDDPRTWPARPAYPSLASAGYWSSS